MSDCLLHSQLTAYHDGELGSEAIHLFANHLPACPACSAELEELNGISGLFSASRDIGKHNKLSSLELARLHNYLKDAGARKPAEADFLRTAGMLSALAASILIISSVWLVEFPSRHAAALSPGVAVVPASEFSFMPDSMPDWERTAFTLRVEPSQAVKMPAGIDQIQIPEIGLADSRSFSDYSSDAQVADWMVAGLSGGSGGGMSSGAGWGGGHANP